MRTVSVSFGELHVRIELGSNETLLAVHLSEAPPASLTWGQLQRCVELLSRHPLPEPVTTAEAAFHVALQSIRPGCVRTYGELARELGTAPRAIASRCSANRLLLRLPCHRVVAQDGLGGFRLGRVWKERLLDLERRG